MNDRKITLLLFGVLLLLFGTQALLQRTLLPLGQPITGLFGDLIRYSQDNQWSEAETSALKLEREWARYRYLVSLNYAEEDYSLLTDTIFRLYSAARSKDSTETTAQARAGLALWKNFLKFTPEP
ncbi:MAG TPA: hypothetical protein VHY08_10125 [Bacillota bacterium]|nr:hypothetical protein [Bacillota bacterium]